MKNVLVVLVLMISFSSNSLSQLLHNPHSNHGNSFEELGFLLPTPNENRTASGAPGPKYWQQRADYEMDIILDESNNILTGNETITYYNNAPTALTYLWVQLDENFHNPNADANHEKASKLNDRMTEAQMMAIEPWRNLEGYGLHITSATDAGGKTLRYTINQTMMRIDLPVALQPGKQFVFKIGWNYKINDKLTRGGRGGFEHFAEEGNNLYSIAQFYPRMAVYSDFMGWQTQQFTGGAEFALTFGNFKVNITAPADHIVAATGQCVNYKSLLTPLQMERWNQAQHADAPVEIVTLQEAVQASKQKSRETKTWKYEAENVRDFAFNTSRRLVWDAFAINIEGRQIMCMSYYGKEAYPLYRKYSSKVVAHTLRVYSKYTIPYPYPVAISVEAATAMEYPMLAMNHGRAEPDGTYSEAVKNGMIGVVIHEVGHNFFPMIVNSDERQYWWMDEGLNSFVQYLAEQEFDPHFPSKRGPADKVVDYMKLPKDLLEPIMTKADAVLYYGSNAYTKAATGLNILRETIMGRELFDFAFKEYARRWAFRHPTPSDLFRTLEDASAIDLDWFWRGWYFGTDPVDISIDNVTYYRVGIGSSPPPLQGEPIASIRNKEDRKITYAVDRDTTLRDYYFFNRDADERYNQAIKDKQLGSLADSAATSKWANDHFYELTFSNIGGLIMPLILQWTYKDGTTEIERVPVGIWKTNEKRVTKVFIKNKEVSTILLDPYKETADINEANGTWPLKEVPSRFQLFKQAPAPARGQSIGGNAMKEDAPKPGETLKP